MLNNEKKYIVLNNMFWKFMERSGVQGIQFIVQIVLARLLLPKDYGLISLVTIFIAIANVFVQSGFNTALIQKKDADEVDFSSVFYLSLGVATIMYILIFFGAPLVSKFYREPELTTVIRVLAITLFFGAFNSIQNTVIAKRMQFKKLFFSSLGAALISGVVGIVLAYLGLGVWALVFQQILSQISITLILWFTVKWRPKLVFSIDRVKELFHYGFKLLVSSLINTIDMNLRNLVIGKIYTSDVLGMYNRGEQFPSLIVNNINGSIQSVMLPTLSSEQDNKEKIKAIVRRSIVTSSFIIFPAMVGLSAIAEPIVRILLTDKWLHCVPFLQIFCFIYALMPIHTANLQAINAIGRSDIFLKLEIYKKVISIIILIITIPYGVYAIVLGECVGSIISSFINASPNLKLINYSYREQLEDIMPSAIISLIMGIIIYPIKLLNITPIVILILQIGIGIIVYIMMAKIFKLECFTYLLSILQELLKKRRSRLNFN